MRRVRTNLWNTLNTAVGGQLRQTLEAWQADGLSWEKMARRFLTDYGINVAGETLRTWVRDGVAA